MVVDPKYRRTYYDSVEFNLANGQTNYDLKANQSSSFNNMSTASEIRISTDYDITVRFNETDNDPITITSSESPFIMDLLTVKNIYISNASWYTAFIRIRLFDV